MWILRTPGDGERTFTFRILPGNIKTLGRAVRADFSVEAPLVSRFHCRLVATPTGQLEVVDLDSTNGTFVNDRKIQQAILAAGDRLRVGRLELTVDHEELEAPAG
ncbi:MAG: FHA domain-containing protein [Vicinamibacterales bacterium]